MRSEDWAGGAVGLVIAVAILAIASVVGWQVLYWLKNGVWPALSVGKGLYEAGVRLEPISWIGLQKVVNFVLKLFISDF